MFVWSTTGFPNPTTDFSNKFETPVIRTKMDSGRTRQRARFTTGCRLMPVSWELTDEQYALFQGVLKHKLSNGADWFTISLPLGDGFDTYTARFTEDGYDAQYVSTMNWKIKSTLEVENNSVLSEAEVDAILP